MRAWLAIAVLLLGADYPRHRRFLQKDLPHGSRVCVTNWTPASERFNDNWVAAGASVTANSVACPVAPDGTQTMDLITFNSGDGNGIYRTVNGMNATRKVSHSIYVARKTSGAACTLNLTDSDTAGAGVNQVVPASGTVRIQDPGFVINVAKGGVYLNTKHAADCVDVCAWGAQLEQSDTVGFYVPTPDTAAFTGPVTVCR